MEKLQIWRKVWEELMIKEANVTLKVNDLEKSVRFYTDTSVLELKSRYGDNFVQVEAPGTIIALHPVTGDGPKPGHSESISVGFAVSDLDTAKAELESKGVKFSRTADDTQVGLAFFTDPDGNPLYLSQSKWGLARCVSDK